jgi:hypothetical protein
VTRYSPVSGRSSTRACKVPPRRPGTVGASVSWPPIARPSASD